MEKVEKDFILLEESRKMGDQKFETPSTFLYTHFRQTFIPAKMSQFSWIKKPKSSLPRRDKEGEGCPGQDEWASSVFLEIFEEDNIYVVKNENRVFCASSILIWILRARCRTALLLTGDLEHCLAVWFAGIHV